MRIKYDKMNGLGNDFVIIRDEIDQKSCQIIADRNIGVGCDQVLILQPSTKADIFMKIVNADGSIAKACGNGTRCVAWLLGKDNVAIETEVCVLNCRVLDCNNITVEMGRAEIIDDVQVNMGNPHLVYFVDDLETLPVPNPNYNCEYVKVISPSHLKMRVFERGVGETKACGTGACAVAAMAVHKNFANKNMQVQMPGGNLMLEVDDKYSITMTGPVEFEHKGEFLL